MKGKNLVLALGGNAIQSNKDPGTAEAQLEVIKLTCEYIAEICEEGYEITIVHGNGPQVGRILLASEAGADVTPIMPFDVCGAMSQGYIGYHLQQGLGYSLLKRGVNRPAVSVVTQIVVDESDPGFKNPSKPIGAFYSIEKADELFKTRGFVMKEDAGRGYRRVVPSPMPVEIVEIDSIKKLIGSSIVITCGGGGVPVIRKKDGSLAGVAAVIDKDFAAGLLAESIGADTLVILTEVEKVSLNYMKPGQKELSRLTYSECEKYCAENQFAAGSMLPKIQAAMKFVKLSASRKAIITSLSKAKEALVGRTGTRITHI